MKNKSKLIFGIIILIALIISILGWLSLKTSISAKTVSFDGERALKDVEIQTGFGPRIPGSEAHKNAISYMQSELSLAGWNSKVLEQKYNGHTAYNILATRNSSEPVLLLGAHYDSRLAADNDPIPENRQTPVPGANDGASGVAILLELARVLPSTSIPTALLFIDIEDNGRIPDWDWILGSRAFSNEMDFIPHVMILVDMIGDANLNIFKEKNSDPELTAQIWKTAEKLGYKSNFIPTTKYQVLDDHIPFIEKGIRSVDIIDLDYVYWHTTQDTPDKVSALSLKIVGSTLLAWINDYGTCIASNTCTP